MNKFLTCTISIVFTSSLLTGCKKDQGPSDELKKAAVTNYASIVYANYSDALSKAQLLKTSIDVFVATPTQSNFDAAKQAWLEARLPYGQTEVFRFYSGPIDDDNGPEGLINAWPMDEAYLDYVQGNATSGLINDLTFTITKSNIEAQNENGGETNISCGFHAIEFLLWGQDLSTTSAGSRPYTDFIPVTGTALNQARRCAYLKAIAELLVDNLQDVTNAWSPSQTGNYRQDFVNGNSDAAISKMIQGTGFLSKGELAGERLEVAYDSQLQEDEHSCFSDNTHNDVQMNALGILNVINGTYKRTDGSVITGTSVYDVVSAKDANTANELKAAVELGYSKSKEIAAPFDQQIVSSNVSGRVKVKTVIDALKAQGDKIAEAASKLSFSIIIE
jgi:putative iron-regulated protein